MKTWIAGIISALSGAFVTAATTMVVAPQEFNFETGTRKILIVAAFSAAVALCNYLKQSPLPNGRTEVTKS